jgi:hypothetical protein
MPFFVSFFEGNLPVPLIAAIPMSETKSVTKKKQKKKIEARRRRKSPDRV